MFTVNKQMVSARINESEQQTLDAFIVDYQNRHNVAFTSFKEFLFHLAKNDVPTVSDKEVIEVESIRDDLKSYADRNEIEMESTAIDIVQHALTTIVEPEQIEVEKPIAFEPGENTLLLEGIPPKDMEILKTVNKNRNDAIKREVSNAESETIETTAYHLIFNHKNLSNWSGGCYTGLDGTESYFQ